MSRTKHVADFCVALVLQSKKATETDLRREFEMYGAIESVRIVRDKKGKSTGYAFVVFERERDMKGELTSILLGDVPG